CARRFNSACVSPEGFVRVTRWLGSEAESRLAGRRNLLSPPSVPARGHSATLRSPGLEILQRPLGSRRAFCSRFSPQTDRSPWYRFRRRVLKPLRSGLYAKNPVD